MAANLRRLILRWAAALPGAGGCCWAAVTASGGRRKPSFKGIDITGADYARELNLPDADGKPRTLADFKGKVTVVFFGYTQCPDVCPTTWPSWPQVKQMLGADGAGCRVCSSASTPSATRPRC
jgi:protein SCO1/2